MRIGRSLSKGYLNGKDDVMVVGLYGELVWKMG